MKNTKKLLSILLAVLMLASSAVFFAAAEPVALSEANITVYPTANGSIFFGQKISDGVTLSGGEVQYNGAVVPGHFEFVNPDLVPRNASDRERASFIFIPDDTESFTGFQCRRNRNVLFVVKKTMPVVDLENDPPVTKKVPGAGVKLRECEITGGKAINPYNGADITNWKWKNPDTVISNSGYYEAYLEGHGDYEVITAMIYVGFEQSKIELTAAVLPTIGNLVYDPDVTWADVRIEGGRIVERDTDITVPGSFSFAPEIATRKANFGEYNLDVIFTPEDTEKYFSLRLTIPATVEKAEIKCTDKNGNEIVPEITIPCGRALGSDVADLLRPYIHIAEGAISLSFEELEYNRTYPTVGTHELLARAYSSSRNYKVTFIPFILKVVPGEIKVQIRSEAGTRPNEYMLFVDEVDYHHQVKGTFAIYIDGKLLKDGLKAEEKVSWETEKSGEYEVKAVYTPIENDPYFVEDTIVKWNRTLQWQIDAVNCEISAEKTNHGLVRYGTNVTASVKEPEKFRSWKITDQNGKEYLPDGLTKDDLKNPRIKFTMPDFPITVEAKMKGGGIDIGDIDFPDLDFGKLLEGDSPCKLINFLKNLRTLITDMIAKILVPVERIKELS